MVVLSAVDGEVVPSPVVEVGEDLAAAFEASHEILHVMPRSRFEARREAASAREAGYPPHLSWGAMEGGRADRTRASDGDGYTVDEHAEPDAARVAEYVARETLGDGVAVSTRGRVGEVHQRIVQEGDRLDARYVVIGGRKRTAVGKAIFGSTTQSVLLNTSRPVVTVPPSPQDGFPTGPVLAAVDTSDRASGVIEEAAEVAGATDRPLEVVHVVSPGDGTEADGIEVAEDLARSSPADIEFTPVGLVGDPGERIIEYAVDRDASFIVTSGRKRSPVGKVLFGSVTQSVILNAACPVIAVMSSS